MKIAIIPTTGGADPYQGMEVARKLGLMNKSTAERKQIVSRIHDLGLEVSALIAWGGEVDLGKEENRERNIAWGKRINETAADVSAGLWMAHVGVMPEDRSSERWARFRDALAEIGAHASGIGAALAMETGPEPPRTVRAMIEEVGSPSIRVNFDPANLLLWPPHLAKLQGVPLDYETAMRDFDPVAGLRTLIPYVVHVHAKDSVLRPDGFNEEVPLGEGMTSWPVLYSIFQEYGYSGFYAIERECGEDAMGDVARAVQYLRAL
jgi:sugar phosphate isomerase/epimerase